MLVKIEEKTVFLHRFCLCRVRFMQWNEQMRTFVAQHLNDDLGRLLLSAHRYPGVDVPFAVDQIEARRRLRTKLPEWYALEDIVMGGRVPAEQCSSEQTARFKQSLIPAEARSLCDLTGGMGVDLWYMSEGLERAIYTERQPHLVAAARHNYEVLAEAYLKTHPGAGVPEFVFREGDGREMPLPEVDVLYLDPARRAESGSRVYAIEDCEPNIIEWQDELLSKAPTVIVKVSPMVDIADILRRVHSVSDVYVVGVRNECKEVLVRMQRHLTSGEEGVGRQVVCHCVDFLSVSVVSFDFVWGESGTLSLVNDGVLPYLYEPDVTLMKAQAFKELTARFGVFQLEADTHIFSSEHLVADFPGRIFRVEDQQPFSSSILKKLRRWVPQANVAVRNFPVSADALRQRAGIRDGGDVYLFGVSVVGIGPVLLKCSKI